MRLLAISAHTKSSQCWWWVRQVFGDAAYENYLRSIRRGSNRRVAPETPLSPLEFYLDSLRRRYSQISRCC